MICKRCGQEKQYSEMADARPGKRNLSTCMKCRVKSQNNWKRSHPKVRLLQFARSRARMKNLEYNLTTDDFELPEYCPVLGIKLELGNGKLQDSSPTLDRLDKNKGYIKGNVAVISYKANRMKNNATLSELKALVSWLEQRLDNTEERPERESVETIRQTLQATA